MGVLLVLRSWGHHKRPPPLGTTFKANAHLQGERPPRGCRLRARGSRRASEARFGGVGLRPGTSSMPQEGPAMAPRKVP
eukprot:7790027-Pyramimonas_sp.AAC.1